MISGVRWLVVLCLVTAACSKEDAGLKPVDAKVWREKHKVALDDFYGKKVPAVVALIKDLPAVSVHVANPEVPMNLFVDSYATGKEPPFEQQNAVIVRGVQLPGLPEYGKKLEKQGSEMGYISVNWVGYIDWDNLNSLRETDKPASDTSAGAADTFVRDIKRLRFLIVTREVSYERGVIDVAAKTFTPGTFKGVAHIVDLQGPKHLGSLAYSATNTGSFESGKGNEHWWLENDLQTQTMRAFNAELRKLFPMIVMEELE